MEKFLDDFVLPLLRSFLMAAHTIRNIDNWSAYFLVSIVALIAIGEIPVPEISRPLALLLIWLLAVAIAAAVIMPLVLFIYHVRSTFRSVYGLTEIAFGISSILYALIQLLHGGSTTTAVFTIGGGVYVLIRGLDNIDRLEDSHPVKRWFVSLMAYIREGRR
ncbi:hypothetical protein HL658_09680 [Azospirillum sp. RWY-5-1]|uniref:DUF805 domain-containing protein n=1 Tax=Azospirillum oleiclasticum TaxID=2735135 RepID=A0ABX2T721_9PROT|nr:hypothetical protein [Azospirillum oleiclasticum]NYZ12821.1 hypothetical protein [Azospirillum oleiclasticum]NYZ19981.1 hypothetical protein [Azospirillum oleiclasticum]